MLTPDQRQAYADDGYLVLPGFKSAGRDRRRLRARPRARRRLRARRPHRRLQHARPGGPGRRRAHRLGRRRALLLRGRGLRCRRPAAWCRRRSRSTRSATRCTTATRCSSASRTARALAALAADLGLEQPQVWQSQVIFKQPGIGGEVRWHQDATFFVTTPVSVTTFWFALEDAALDNGCLWVEPGGHRGARGVLRERFVRDGERLRTETARRHALARPGTARAAAGAGGHAGGVPRPAAALQRRQPQPALAAGLHAARDRRARGLFAASNWLQRGGVRGLD